MFADAALVLYRANRKEGCLGKAKEDEPVFVLRAQDKFAPAIVEAWADEVAGEAPEGENNAKVLDARMIAAAMRSWQKANRVKVPD